MLNKKKTEKTEGANNEDLFETGEAEEIEGMEMPNHFLPNQFASSSSAFAQALQQSGSQHRIGDKYLIGKRIGNGAFGEIFLGLRYYYIQIMFLTFDVFFLILLKKYSNKYSNWRKSCS